MDCVVLGVISNYLLLLFMHKMVLGFSVQKVIHAVQMFITITLYLCFCIVVYVH